MFGDGSARVPFPRGSVSRSRKGRMRGWIGGNTGPIWPPDDNFFTDMTAIALVYTKAGFVVAADGLSRWGDDATRDALARQNESDHEQKVFKAAFGSMDIAWAVTGSAFNKDRSFSLIIEAGNALQATNAGSPRSFGDWLDLFAFRLRDSVSDARKSGSIAPFTENQNVPALSDERFTFARILMAGYFCNGRPSIAITRLSHEGGILTDPQTSISTPPRGDLFSGSSEISERYFRQRIDDRFKKYYRPSGSTLEAGLAHAKGYIQACSDPLAAELDPICRGIGGHIHAAAVTPSGFQWLIPPV
jgi:hypothetical protein